MKIVTPQGEQHSSVVKLFQIVFNNYKQIKNKHLFYLLPIRQTDGHDIYRKDANLSRES